MAKRKTSVKAKEAAGTSRADRKTDVVEYTADIKKPPTFLSAEGKRIYHAVCEHLLDNKGLAAIDHYEISVVANSFDLYIKAAKIVRKQGAYQTTRTGYSQVRAEYTVMKSEAINIMKYAEKYGLNQAAREKILAFSAPKNKDDDPFDGI